MPKYRGQLYGKDEQGNLAFAGSFCFTAENRKEAMKTVLDMLWDARLDAASCAPHFVWESVTPSDVPVPVPKLDDWGLKELLEFQIECLDADGKALELFERNDVEAVAAVLLLNQYAAIECAKRSTIPASRPTLNAWATEIYDSLPEWARWR